jgi:hypothetical protein
VTPIVVAKPLLPDTGRPAPYLREIDATRIDANHGPLVRRLETTLGHLVPPDRDARLHASSTRPRSRHPSRAGKPFRRSIMA